MNANKENVFRTLKEEPLLASNWCSVGFHQWMKYGEPKQTRRDIYTYLIQERYCASCNKMQLNQIQKW